MPQALVLYHFFHPDDVVSSRHFSDLAAGLAERGWDVVARPCNLGCRDDRRTYVRSERARNVLIRRIWRPRLSQATSIGRLLNATWMLSAWTLSVARLETPEIIIIGTDPILSVLVAIPWKLMHPKTRIAHWCLDLYPEAAIADNSFPAAGALAGILRRLLKYAYGCCDLVADIGPCMRELLSAYNSSSRTATITPWALIEPPATVGVNTRERRNVFGTAALGLMYSGNFGRAHGYDSILQLARAVRGKSIRFAFSVRGNRAEELRGAISADDDNIGFVPFADEAQLEARLSAADIHIVTLREEWTGAVVPSKFFGALAAGRPVLFAGSSQSSVARWIREYKVGWVLNLETQSEVMEELCGLAERPEQLHRFFDHCRVIYQSHFSRVRVIDRFERELRSMIVDRKPALAGGGSRVPFRENQIQNNPSRQSH